MLDWLLLLPQLLHKTDHHKITPLNLSSEMISTKHKLPVKYTCYGRNKPLVFTWKPAPSNTKSLILLMQDLNQPHAKKTQWSIVNISPKQTHIRTDNPNNQLTFYNAPYFMTNPCLQHRFQYTLISLNTLIPLNKQMHNYSQLKNYIQRHQINTSSLTTWVSKR